ncbi:LPS export ABC transporter ATP-binding protein [bacterium]|nr:LPS export ABC transporter ATP-binding protein [bacterium]MBU1153739.1 LPS export ABC transporter ATP-binding protein [bacterium]MBU2600370.1 LPS export ABC transporter ATP-binding protein [bacterium]
MKNNILMVEDISKTYHGRKVVNKVSIKVEQGEIVGLLGPNGAGKTTTFYIMVGLISSDHGQVKINDLDITKFPMYKRARLGVGYLPQEPSIFQGLTVEENILSILEMLHLPRQKRMDKLNQVLKEFKIEHLSKQKAYTLSGGERRRTEIARLFVTSPCFILLDEPFLGVDPIAVFDIQQIIINLKNKGLGILITDHSVRETLQITDQAYIMHEGKVLISGSSSELVNNPKAREIYLGEHFTL